jgi:hypothetical protein
VNSSSASRTAVCFVIRTSVQNDLIGQRSPRTSSLASPVISAPESWWGSETCPQPRADAGRVGGQPNRAIRRLASWGA